MTNITRTNKIQIGLHASTTDFTSTPASLKFHNLKSQVMIDPDYNYEDREDYLTCAAEPLSALQLNKALEGVPDLTFEMKGLDTAIADGVTSTGADFPLAEIFESCFAAIIQGQGDTGAATAGSGTTLTVDGSSASSIRGSAVLIETASSRRLVREIGAASGSNYTLCRSLLDASNVAENAAANADIWGCRTYNANNQVADRKHLYFDAEGADWRRTLFAAAGNLAFKFPSGNLAECTLGGIKISDWSNPAVATPACTTAAAGNEIPVYSIVCTIDNAEYEAYDVELDLGIEWIPRPSDAAPNGVRGYLVKSCKPKIKLKLRAGSLTAPKEVTDAVLDTLRGSGTIDLLLQFGNTTQGCVAFRAPALSVKAKRIDADGLEAIEIDGMCSVASENSNTFGTSPLRFHIF